MAKSKLQKKKEDDNSKYWKKKADSEITRLYRGQPCIVCGTREGTCGHHLVSRAALSTRHNTNLIVALCQKHHTFGRELSAHGAPLAFAAFLQENYPQIWQTFLENRFKVGTYNFREAYENLKGVTSLSPPSRKGGDKFPPSHSPL